MYVAYGEQRSTSDHSSDAILFLIFCTGSLASLKLAKQNRMAALQAPGNPLCLSPQHWDYVWLFLKQQQHTHTCFLLFTHSVASFHTLYFKPWLSELAISVGTFKKKKFDILLEAVLSFLEVWGCDSQS